MLGLEACDQIAKVKATAMFMNLVDRIIREVGIMTKRLKYESFSSQPDKVDGDEFFQTRNRLHWAIKYLVFTDSCIKMSRPITAYRHTTTVCHNLLD